MKYLQDYIQNAQTELFDELGVFFAFNREQFDEGAAKHKARKPDGTKWADLGMGMFMPSVHVEEFIKRHTQLVKEGMRRDVEENTKEGVILRELNNYECFYTGDVGPAVEALEGYGITSDEVRTVFRGTNSVEVGA